MIEIVITPNQALIDLISSLEMVSTKKLPNTVKAIKASISLLEYTWKSYAMGASIPGTNIRIKRIDSLYVKSIQSKTSGLKGVVFSDSPVAVQIEEDSPEKDLKKIIPFGPKSRMGKNGPYNIVPFRHGTPKAVNAPMPELVYKALRQKIKQGELQKSEVLRAKRRDTNAGGEVVQRRTYKWGGRVKEDTFPDLQGLVVFRASVGAASRSTYLTFRVVSANKPKVSKARKGWEKSWIVPSKRGAHLTRYVVANTKDVIIDLLRTGLEHDLL